MSIEVIKCITSARGAFMATMRRKTVLTRGYMQKRQEMRFSWTQPVAGAIERDTWHPEEFNL